MKFYLLFFLCLSFFSLNATAEIYRSVDKDGIITYSDQPNATSETVTLTPANIAVQPLSTTNSTNGTTDATEKKEPYTTFKIAAPKDQETIFNATEINVSADVGPALQKGDKIQFYYDDAAVGEASVNTSITINKVQDGKEFLVRGSHTIYATLVNEAGEVLNTTPTITIFLQYASVINSPLNAVKKSQQ